MEIIMGVLIFLLIVSVFGYLMTTMVEKRNLVNRTISIKSNNVTQAFLDGLDMKMFKLGKLNMNIGDEIKIVTHDKLKIKGTLLGAKKTTNQIYLLTSDDKVVDLNVAAIEYLVITSKYGRFF